MEHRNIGSLSVSLVGIGCNNMGWRIDATASRIVVDAALEAGINFFDTADFYAAGKSEEFLGQAVGQRRGQVLIATKFGLPMDDTRKGAKPAYVKQAAEDSLRRLGTDYIDLYQLHRPDPETPIAETLGALEELVKAGKVREIGCSNFTVEQLKEAEAAAAPGAAKFQSVQNHYSMLHREPEEGVLAECERQGLGFLPYFPLENGILTGKYHAGGPVPEGSRAKDGFGPKVFTEENLRRVDALSEFAKRHGHSMLQLAMSWLAAKPVVASVIAGAKTAEQVRTNAASVGWKLSQPEMDEVNALLGYSDRA
jgi:aryl-alcohol dehydrogenase-like predicted oxidoreductase